MQIDRTRDGSYGTVTLEYNNRALYVFDDYELSYESGMKLGLIEENSVTGWTPRKFFVANGSLMPTLFNSIYQYAFWSATPTFLLLITTATTLSIL